MPWPRFSDIFGQDRALDALRRSIAARRVHHAWLFSGPSGVGKMLAAKAFAGLLLDPTLAPNLSGELEADDASEARRLLDAGAHPDFVIVAKELAAVSRKEQVRNQKQRNIALEVLLEFLIEPATRAAVAARRAVATRVFVIDESHLMDRYGANATLKTLEEPHPGVVIILISDQESDLPATIRSRCRRLAFSALSPDAMERWLASARLEMPGARREWLLRFAAGSPGAFLRAHEAGLPEWADRLTPMLTAAANGRYTPEFAAEVKSLVNAEAERRVELAGPNASKDAANKAAAGDMFALLTQWSRDSLRRRVAQGADPEPAALAAELIADAERMLDQNAFAEIALDDLASQLSRL